MKLYQQCHRGVRVENRVSKQGKEKLQLPEYGCGKVVGKLFINKRELDQYYTRETSKMIVRHPLELTGNSESFDITINVCGGGLTGQAGAARHGYCPVVGGNESRMAWYS